ncbi:unnamed protein product [Lactuca virosa]|uniref:Uncharacterized protein n=1 Tax=Lactuca virosa TaxID=75947 RepID=A0AAU9NB83_9ASTR|nr:unnamed protein product [Lactuca virosa]
MLRGQLTTAYNGGRDCGGFLVCFINQLGRRGVLKQGENEKKVEMMMMGSCRNYRVKAFGGGFVENVTVTWLCRLGSHGELTDLYDMAYLCSIQVYRVLLQMETQSIRLRLVFEDGSLLSETQRSDGMNQSWLLVEPNQHQKISDVCNHLLHNFNLHDSCPNGILLYVKLKGI